MHPLHFLILVVIIKANNLQTEDLICNSSIWTSVFGTWDFPAECEYKNTDAVNGAMSWIGENLQDSLSWSDYTATLSMTPSPDHLNGNGGLAFNVQEVGACGTCGKYYGVSLFLSNPDQLYLHLGKWNNQYSTIMEWYSNQRYSDNTTYNIKVSTTNGTISCWLDDEYLGEYTDTEEPIYFNGSIGIRNYLLPSLYTNVYVTSLITTTTTKSPSNDCTWSVLSGEHILDLNNLKNTLIHAPSNNDNILEYEYTPCTNKILNCNDINNMFQIANLSSLSCVKYLAIWDNGQVIPAYNINLQHWIFTYSNGESCNGQPAFLRVMWNCDEEVGEYLVQTAAEISECFYEMQIRSKYACN